MTACAENHVTPREDRRRLRSRPLPSEKTSIDYSELCWLEAVGEQIGELIASGHSLQTEMSDLCRFVRKVLTNVDMLRTLSATDHIVSPLNAINRRRRCGSEAHVPQQLTQINDLHRTKRCRVVLRLRGSAVESATDF